MHFEAPLQKTLEKPWFFQCFLSAGEQMVMLARCEVPRWSQGSLRVLPGCVQDAPNGVPMRPLYGYGPPDVFRECLEVFLGPQVSS